jgi:hypothetical protein
VLVHGVGRVPVVPWDPSSHGGAHRSLPACSETCDSQEPAGRWRWWRNRRERDRDARSVQRLLAQLPVLSVPLTGLGSGRILQLFPPRGSPEFPWVPTGHGPWGFFFLGVPVGQAGDLPRGRLQPPLLCQGIPPLFRAAPIPVAGCQRAPALLPQRVRPWRNPGGNPLLHGHPRVPHRERPFRRVQLQGLLGPRCARPSASFQRSTYRSPFPMPDSTPSFSRLPTSPFGSVLPGTLNTNSPIRSGCPTAVSSGGLQAGEGRSATAMGFLLGPSEDTPTSRWMSHRRNQKLANWLRDGWGPGTSLPPFRPVPRTSAPPPRTAGTLR